MGAEKLSGEVKRIYTKDRMEARNNQIENSKEKQQFYIKEIAQQRLKITYTCFSAAM